MSIFLAKIKKIVENQPAFIALILLILVAIVIFPTLASVEVLMDMLRGYSMVGIVSMGMTFVILTGGIDLSVGSVAAVAGFSAAIFADSLWFMPILIPIAAGTLLGFINGLVITKFKAPPFIATLAMMMGARGISLIMSGEKPLGLKGISYGFAQIGQGDTLGVPNLVWIFVFVTTICLIVSKWTRFGRSVYAVGGNEEAAKMMGFNPDHVKLMVYTISGFCAGLAGMMLTSRLASAQNTAGQGWELTAIATVVIGGTLLAGGRGNFSGTIYGVLIYAVVEIVLGRFSLMVWWINILTGILVLIVVISQNRNSAVNTNNKKTNKLRLWYRRNLNEK